MEKGLETVEKEIAGEKAAALGRSGRKLRSALDKLRRFDESSRRSPELEARTRLIETAGEALWAYVVQREAVGLIDAEYIRKEYAVPAEVWQHMRPKMEAAQANH
jgi:predicted urease superfamily metal-dependent hydrolase